MSEERANPSPFGSSRMKRELQRLRMERRTGIFGVAEIIGLVGSAVIVITVIISYVYFLIPARSHLQAILSERSRLQNQLRDSRDVIRQGQDTQSTVTRITESLEDFEDNRLSSRNQGRMGLYDELNRLIRTNGLRNTSGPSYTSLDTLGSKTTGTNAASTRWQSVYPGIGVSLTVEGPYQNLRRFVRDLEANRQFIIINAIELERATETNSTVSVGGASARGSRGSLVSLRLNMATYFRRGTV